MMVLGVVVNDPYGVTLESKPYKMPYFLGVLAAFLAARSARAEQFSLHTV
jgi:hypothetical protein